LKVEYSSSVVMQWRIHVLWVFLEFRSFMIKQKIWFQYLSLISASVAFGFITDTHIGETKTFALYHGEVGGGLEPTTFT
jgi:uncharacterized membrane protein YqhA